MDVTYRGRRPASRLERLLARLVPAMPGQEPVATRLDFIVSDDLEVSQV